jgi:hypothetical protein
LASKSRKMSDRQAMHNLLKTLGSF